MATASRWVFLRGLAREARHWDHFPEDFHAFHPDAEIVALDLPGAGNRHAERAPASVDGLVEACRSQVDLTAGPVYLLGLSLGGMACAQWACRHPEEVAGAVLLNTSMRPFNGMHRRLRPRNVPALARIVMDNDRARREAGILALTSRDAASREDLVARWAQFARERPMSRGTIVRQLWAAARYRARRRAPKVPLLVLASAADRLVDPDCSRAIARAWNAPIAIHPTAGHDITLDDGPWVAAQVRRWLSNR
jgi:pimeloyl-ACP methyl ester carboxylesterase